MSEPMTNAIHWAPSGIIDNGEPEPQKKISNSSEKIIKVKSIFDSLSIYESTTKIINVYHKRALESLKKITVKNKDSLNYFVNLLVKREL